MVVVVVVPEPVVSKGISHEDGVVFRIGILENEDVPGTVPFVVEDGGDVRCDLTVGV
jgi:hypothetical protein